MSNGLVSLYKKYEDYFPIGAAVNPQSLKIHRDLLINQFSSLTSENHMKFEALQPEKGVFNFTVADELTAFAKEHNKLVRGHTLVWHNQNPAWLFQDDDGNRVNRDTLLARLKEHAETVMQRYKDTVYCWDVVNEAVEDTGPEVLRQRSPWLEIIGEDFIEQAFIIAHEANPDALLFYNDYNESEPAKRDKIYQLVKGLKEKDVPIHGVGLQAHWNIYGPSIDVIREAIEKYAELGVVLHVTEMDLSMFEFHDRRTDLTEPTEEMLERQAQRYEEIFSLFREYKDVVTNVTLWCAADDMTWLHNFPVRGRTNWPLLFDMKHNPKPAFDRIIKF
jgi:endo-1,4-beta-xylanase